MSNRPRILVAGGGPVGLGFACAATGFEVVVVEATPAPEPPGDGAYDARIYAVSPGTRDFLRATGAWDHLDMRRVAPVRRMVVRGDAGARLAFTPPARGALAWIVEAPRLAAALAAAAADDPRITLRRGVPASAFGAQAGAAWIALESGERLEGDLLVGADGPDSRVRSALDIASEESPYGETAVVANFDVERDHEGAARQWFRTDGVLAWLPLPGKRISIVWSAPTAIAKELLAMEPQAFAQRVCDAGGAELGDLQLASRPTGFPLRLVRVPQPVAPGVALIGDAAHAVHPLAGQGVNLGFQDARVLAEVLAARTALERPGDLRVLRRYARGRREDVTAMQWVTDGLDRLFASGNPAAAGLRNLGLRLVDLQPWARRALGERAMR